MGSCVYEAVKKAVPYLRHIGELLFNWYKVSVMQGK